MTFTNITTAGAGTMGSQVAWQMAFHGKHVTVYDAIPAGLEKGKAFHQEYAELFMSGAAPLGAQIDDTFARLTYTTDLASGGARCRSDQRVRARVHGHQGIVLARGVQARPGAHRVHHQHLHPGPERVGGLRRSAAEVPGLALRHRRVGLQHR